MKKIKVCKYCQSELKKDNSNWRGRALRVCNGCAATFRQGFREAGQALRDKSKRKEIARRLKKQGLSDEEIEKGLGRWDEKLNK